MKGFIAALVILALMPNLSLAGELEYRGELSFAGTLWEQEGLEGMEYPSQRLSRYIPLFDWRSESEGDWSWDAQFSAQFYSLDQDGQNGKADLLPYRAWVRAYSESMEWRFGLQELSFGPAQLLRTMQWFDNKSLLDPTNFTEGVKALLFRVDREDNRNYWLWAQYGNDYQSGALFGGADPDRPAFGGRAQFPFDQGEWALTLHKSSVLSSLSGEESSVDQQKIGVDVKLDLAFGLWLEAAQTTTDELLSEIRSRKATLGADFSFESVEGLILILERSWEDLATDGETYVQIDRDMALIVTYQNDLLNQYRLTAMNSEPNEVFALYRFDWQRTYDDFLFSLALFQAKYELAGIETSQRGLGLVLQYNH